jgi:hypothetical protein
MIFEERFLRKNMDKPIWWEKTVEYAFVVEAAKNGLIDFAAPLSGKHETTAADAILSVSSKLVLIEFKKDRDGIPTEKSMFIDYKKAQNELQIYGHHHIVYAECTGAAPVKLELKAEKYFKRENAIDALECLKTGVDQKKFNIYLKALAALKLESKQGSGGHVSPEAFSTVFGVTENGKLVEFAALYDYAPTQFPRPEPRTDHTPYDPPTP